jgi:hypothetical protein
MGTLTSASLGSLLLMTDELKIESSDMYKNVIKSFVRGNAILKSNETIEIKVNTQNSKSSYVSITFDLYMRFVNKEVRETDCEVQCIKTNVESDFIFWMFINVFKQTCESDICQQTLKLKLDKTPKSSIIDKIVYSPTQDHPTFKLQCTPGRKMSLLTL